ncbi:hypothetical protein BGY98DRAFT_1099122 [Russula aff. rugulosa BPL654]|nr:hypothetical protein BGY98DRAFT_1099122 [Russula aff. rugulosa BPL654]
MGKIVNESVQLPIVGIRKSKEILSEEVSPFSPAKTIFTGIGILLGAVKDVIASYEALVKLLERIQFFLQRLNHYTSVPLTPGMTELLAKIMAQILSILALSTKTMKERRISWSFNRYTFSWLIVAQETFMKRLMGKTDVEDAFERLDTLTKEENLMTAARTFEATHHVDTNGNTSGIGSGTRNGVVSGTIISRDRASPRQFWRRGEDVNATNGEGCVPLHAAAQSGYREIAEPLPRSGASLDARNKKQTPLELSCFNGRLDMTHFLIDHGSDINSRDENDFISLHAASISPEVRKKMGH